MGTCGSLLGVFEDVEVAGDELVLAPGDALVFYTDGVTERRNGDLMFGDDSLLAICEAAAGSSADALAGQLEEAVRTFGEQASRDDLAVLVVRATGDRPRVQPVAGRRTGMAPSRLQMCAIWCGPRLVWSSPSLRGCSSLTWALL